MKWIGHFEFGKDYIPFFEGEYKVKSFSSINHWLEQWKLLYESLIDLKLKNEYFLYVMKSFATVMTTGKISNHLLVLKTSVNLLLLYQKKRLK